MHTSLMAQQTLYILSRMNPIRLACLSAAFAVAALLSPAGVFAAGGTLYQNTDNENFAGTHVSDDDMDRLLGNADGAHPIEFRIDRRTRADDIGCSYHTRAGRRRRAG